MARPKKYPDELIARGVRLVLESERPIAAPGLSAWSLMSGCWHSSGRCIWLTTGGGSSHPSGATFALAILWRGAYYGALDGILLSVFPILAVFHACRDSRLLDQLRGKLAAGALALAVSIAFTAVCHLGYPDFRSSKLAKPIAGDVVWSAPTLLTLSPIGAPLAHVGLHVTAVVHDYDTDLFLPPHA